MNYVILKTNGSVAETSAEDYIQRGSNNANSIKVAFEDSRRDGLVATIYCALPNGSNISLTGVNASFEYKGRTMLGWEFPITSAVTLYAGALTCSLTVAKSGSTLVNYPFTLTVNESGYPINSEWDTPLTIAQYNALLTYIQSLKGDIVFLSSASDLPSVGYPKTLYIVGTGNEVKAYCYSNGYHRISDETSLKSYVDSSVQTASTTLTQAIATAKTQANSYTDEECAKKLDKSLPELSQMAQSDNAVPSKKFVEQSIAQAISEADDTHITGASFTETSRGNWKLTLARKDLPALTAEFDIPEAMILDTTNPPRLSGHNLILTFQGGTELSVDLEGLVDIYTGSVGEYITISVENGVIKATFDSEWVSFFNTAYSNENVRISNETARVTAENARAEAEAQRVRDFSSKQGKSDDSLETSNKTIVGAINELNEASSEHDGRIHALEKELGHLREERRWFDIVYNIRNGLTENYYGIGEQIVVDYSIGSTSYSCPMNIAHIGKAEFEDGSVIDKAMYLEWQYASDFGLVFDPSEALVQIASGKTLPAGTYHFKVKDNAWFSADNGRYIQFTTNIALTEGMQLRPTQSPNATMVGANMIAYNDGKDTTSRGTFVMSEGQGGTYLGSMWGTDTPNEMREILASNDDIHFINHCHRVIFGYNNWKCSYARQFLNSDGTGWWTPQNVWDRAVDGVDSVQGFLSRLSDGFKSVLKPVKVITRSNNQTDDGEQVITYDKVFIASKKQMAWNDSNDESAQVEEWGYYRKLADEVLGSGGKWQDYQTYPELIRYAINAKTSSQYVWKRSANVGYANVVWNVYTSGYCSYYSAYTTFRVLPACVIG